jgi:predicted ATPase
MTSRTLLEQALDCTNEQTFYTAPLLPLQHLGVTFQRHLAIALWHLGYPDQALQQMDVALARAHDLAHLYTSAAVHSWSAWLYLYRREAALTQAQAETTIALSLEHGFPYWLEQSNILMGWALAQQGQFEAGIARIHRSLDIRETMDAHLHKPAFLALLAEAYGQVGQPEQGLHILDDALDAVEASGEHFSEVEIYRLKGELLRRQGADAREVETHFLHALAIAQQQEAKSLELRVALNLSRLWQQQGRKQEALALLAGIYGWFTEGFSTHDLVETRALLDELS